MTFHPQTGEKGLEEGEIDATEEDEEDDAEGGGEIGREEKWKKKKRRKRKKKGKVEIEIPALLGFHVMPKLVLFHALLIMF